MANAVQIKKFLFLLFSPLNPSEKFVANTKKIPIIKKAAVFFLSIILQKILKEDVPFTGFYEIIRKTLGVEQPFFLLFRLVC